MTVISAASRMVVHVVAASGSKVILDGDSVGWWCSGADVVAITVIVLDMVVTGGGIILVEMDGPPRTRARP